MKKKFITIYFIISAALLTAQKTVHKAVEDKTITSVEIDASQAYKLVVKTAASSRIDIKAVLEGEYKDDLLINTRKEAGRFVISTSFQPLFKHPNDKLSAHKVISILLIVELPENLSLAVSGSSTNVTISGTYETLKANIVQGNFMITNFIGNGELRSFSGNIFIDNYKGKIVPYTKYGKISGRNTQRENQVLSLKTINGSIYINKPK